MKSELDSLMESLERGDWRPKLESVRRTVPDLASSDSAEALDAWRAPFIEWLDSICTLCTRGSSGLDALHRDYIEWELSRDGVPCTRDAFRTMIRELCFPIREVCGTELVQGLCFREDSEAF
jgi:hypothetical protein